MFRSVHRFLASPLVGPIRHWHLFAALAFLYALVGTIGLTVLILGIRAPTTAGDTRERGHATGSAGATPFDEPLRDGDLLAGAIPFDKEIRAGDLSVQVLEVNTGTISGQNYGQFNTLNASLVHVKISNHSSGKIVDWPGWQGKGEIEDEHGNLFHPISLRGWSWLPGNTPDGWGGDFATRINPGTTYENCVYYEPIPKTSHELKVRVPLLDKTVVFQGPPGPKSQRDHARALEEKRGMVFDAAQILKERPARIKTWDLDYPKGCMVRATGRVLSKEKTTHLYAIQNRGDYEIHLQLPTGDQAICFTRDEKLYERLTAATYDPWNRSAAYKGGDTVTLQGSRDDLFTPWIGGRSANERQGLYLGNCIQSNEK
jgi:hypothetical protein